MASYLVDASFVCPPNPIIRLSHMITGSLIGIITPSGYYGEVGRPWAELDSEVKDAVLSYETLLRSWSFPPPSPPYQRVSSRGSATVITWGDIPEGLFDYFRGSRELLTEVNISLNEVPCNELTIRGSRITMGLEHFKLNASEVQLWKLLSVVLPWVYDPSTLVDFHNTFAGALPVTRLEV